MEFLIGMLVFCGPFALACLFLRKLNDRAYEKHGGIPPEIRDKPETDEFSAGPDWIQVIGCVPPADIQNYQLWSILHDDPPAPKNN